MKERKRILVCPLDWGLGHATRCVPVVRELQLQGCEVMIASSGDALRLLQLEFPLLKLFALTGYHPNYSKHSFALSILTQLLKFNQTIRREHAEVEAIANNNAIDIIISDNRYGCWSDKIHSVIITHQLNIQTPILQQFVSRINHAALRKFSSVWIPDFKGVASLSGKLSERGDIAVEYIGPLSRFKKHSKESDKYTYAVVALLSGPEPQRSILEAMLRPQLLECEGRTLLVKGKPGSGQHELTIDATEVDHLSSDVLNDILANAGLVVGRPGYSTIMDLSVMGGKAIFIPTPGQTEQMYLGKMLMDKKIALSVRQKNFNLRESMEASKAYNGFYSSSDDQLLSSAIRSLLS